MKKTPYEYLQEALAVANNEALPAATKALFVGSLILQVAARMIVNLGRDATPVEKLAVKDALLRVYREQIVPIDIPGLPAFIEPYIDSAGEAALAAGVDVLLSRLASMQEEIDRILAE